MYFPGNLQPQLLIVSSNLFILVFLTTYIPFFCISTPYWVPPRVIPDSHMQSRPWKTKHTNYQNTESEKNMKAKWMFVFFLKNISTLCWSWDDMWRKNLKLMRGRNSWVKSEYRGQPKGLELGDWEAFIAWAENGEGGMDVQVHVISVSILSFLMENELFTEYPCLHMHLHIVQSSYFIKCMLPHEWQFPSVIIHPCHKAGSRNWLNLLLWH